MIYPQVVTGLVQFNLDPAVLQDFFNRAGPLVTILTKPAPSAAAGAGAEAPLPSASRTTPSVGWKPMALTPLVRPDP